MATYTGIVLISAATLLLELAWLRLFAVQQFYHFAFMAISLALLGAGASGSILSLLQNRLSAVRLCLLFGLSTIGAYLVINYLPFDSFSIAWDRKQAVYLGVYFLAAAVPFLFAGLLVGGELMAAGPRAGSHRIYAANLIGSAMGSIGSLPVLDALGGERTVVFAAVLGWVAGLLFVEIEEWRLKIRGQPSSHSVLVVVALLGFILIGLMMLLHAPAFLSQRLSPYKTLSVMSQALDSRQALTDWDMTARIDVIESSAIHVMPGLSLLSPVGPPPQAGLLLDGDNLMPITGLSPDSEMAAVLADHMPAGLAHGLRPNGRTLILEAGTGMDVLWALAAGAAEVTAVEENRLVLETVQKNYKEFTGGLYTDPRIRLVNQSGRVYARQPGTEQFDLVIISLTDPHRPVTSGAYSLTEDYVYTVQAMVDYLGKLDENGLLVVTRWLQTPPSESGRLFGALSAALAADGKTPADHLIAFRTLRTMTVIAGASPVAESEIAHTREFLRQRGFDAVYFPGIQAEDLNRHNILDEPVYHELIGRILVDPAGAYDDYRFDIRPSSDNRPFFFHYFKWEQTPEILAGLGLSWQPFGGSGFFVLVALLGLVTVAAAVFIISPLLISRRLPTTHLKPIPYLRLRVFIYFACLGLAFLFVEIPLAQRFILLLGQPVTALAVVIFTILLFSGIGSFTANRWRLEWGLGVLIILVGVYPLLLPSVTEWALRLPEWGRIGVTILTLAPLGYLMGLPFAGGLRLVERHEPALVPWAWAINGSFSVISSVLAVMAALTWGFTAVLLVGAAAYAGALLAFGRLVRFNSPTALTY